MVNAKTVIDAINQTQQNAFNYGNEAVEKTFKLLEDAVNYANNTQYLPLQPNPDYSIIYPPLPGPWDTSIIPKIDSSNSLAYINDWLEKYRLIMNENFSNLLSFDLAEDKLEDILENGYIINTNIHNQIITRVIDAETRKSTSLKDVATKDFIAKGWVIPNSILINRIDAINYDYSQNISNAIKDLAINEENLNTDMIKLAIQQALDLKPKCINIATDFASKYAQMYSFGVDNARAYISGLGVVQSSINSYNSLIFNRTQLGVQDSQQWREYDLRVKQSQVNLEMEKAKIKTQTALSAGEVLGGLGRAALSSQLTMSQLYAGVKQ